jgi:hypothetical protein
VQLEAVVSFIWHQQVYGGNKQDDAIEGQLEVMSASDSGQQ